MSSILVIVTFCLTDENVDHWGHAVRGYMVMTSVFGGLGTVLSVVSLIRAKLRVLHVASTLLLLLSGSSCSESDLRR